MNQSAISKVMSVLGKRGGKVGGKSTSKAKRQSSKDNLAKARKVLAEQRVRRAE